ncbi:MAG: hypothetical protein P8X55_09760, partial [Desulfosarcinaceae bacterium]
TARFVGCLAAQHSASIHLLFSIINTVIISDGYHKLSHNEPHESRFPVSRTRKRSPHENACRSPMGFFASCMAYILRFLAHGIREHEKSATCQ